MNEKSTPNSTENSETVEQLRPKREILKKFPTAHSSFNWGAWEIWVGDEEFKYFDLVAVGDTEDIAWYEAYITLLEDEAEYQREEIERLANELQHERGQIDI